MNKTLLFVVVSVLVVNFVDEHFNRDSFSKTFVSAEPVNNKKHVVKRETANNLIVNGDDEEDEIFVRVKRSPDPNPQPRGGRGGGSRGGSRYRGGSSYRGGYGSGSGGSLSTGAILGIVFGIIGGSLFIGLLIYFCSK